MAESQPRLCFKYKGSLKAKTGAAWRETDSPSAVSPALGNSGLLHAVSVFACPGAYLITLLLAGTYL